MGIKHVGNSVFVDDDPVDVSDIINHSLHGWGFYPYVEFPSLHRAYYGLILAKGGPKSKRSEKKYVSSTEWSESIAPLLDLGDVRKEMMEERRRRYLFEQIPYVEIKTKADYKSLLGDRRMAPKDWFPGQPPPDVSDWKGPGVYDMRDDPPTRSYRSVENYELTSMEAEASEVLEYMFQGDEWKDLALKMFEDNMAEIFSS